MKPQTGPMSAAARKIERTRDATQAMKDHETARQETLAKTARLRAEPKPSPAKKKR